MTVIDMKPSARAVLDRLRQGPATTHDLLGVGGLRFGARLCELRALGFGIDEKRLPLPTRGSRYTLTHDAERPVTPVAEPSAAEAAGSLFDMAGFTSTSHYRRDAA